LSLYLDACVLVPLFVDEAASTDVRQFVDDASFELVVSDLAIAEFGAAISHHVRSDRANEDIARRTLALFDEWVERETEPVSVASADFVRASALVRQFDLKLLTADALHLAICERQGWTLVTLDERLLIAATVVGVPARTV
jgi:uncharacterized protein